MKIYLQYLECTIPNRALPKELFQFFQYLLDLLEGVYNYLFGSESTATVATQPTDAASTTASSQKVADTAKAVNDAAAPALEPQTSAKPASKKIPKQNVNYLLKNSDCSFHHLR